MMSEQASKIQSAAESEFSRFIAVAVVQEPGLPGYRVVVSLMRPSTLSLYRGYQYVSHIPAIVLAREISRDVLVAAAQKGGSEFLDSLHRKASVHDSATEHPLLALRIFRDAIIYKMHKIISK